MSDIIKEVRVRESIYQNRDVKVIIEKSGLFNKKRKVYGIPWGKKEETWSTWEPIEFTINDLTEDNNFGDYSRFYAEYIKERDQPNNIFGFKSNDFHQRNNLEFSSEWNSDLDIIKLYILINTEKYKDNVYEWNLIEDPIVGDKGGPAPYYRSFGVDSYYLNNGVQISINWDNSLGEKWSDDKGNELDNTNPKFYNDKKIIYKSDITKIVHGIYIPDDVVDTNLVGKFIYYKYGMIYTNKEGKYISSFSPSRDDVNVSKASLSGYNNYGGYVNDTHIIDEIIQKWKENVPGYENLDIVKNVHGTPVIYLSDAVEYKRIEYKSPFGTEIVASASGVSASGVSASGPSASGPISTSFKLTFEGIQDGFQVAAKTDLPSFSIYVGDPKKDWPKVSEGDLPQDGEDFENVEGAEILDEDNEYVENTFNAEEESPTEIPEYKQPANYVPDGDSMDPNSVNASSVWTPTGVPGTVVELPGNYSHNKTQGYNILNNQWIGDLIASAKSHIKHPTWDIPGTEGGNLGCASAVSMIFYRAFGVHMKTGQALKSDKPSDISSFGSKGTSELAGWFSGNSLYKQISWKDAQPGDIMNTARNFSTNKAGHIGIVIDEKHKNGSWYIISNSSKGFAGGGGGAIMKNYSVKAWQDVADRNPSGTFAYRYVGPKLSPGQAA